MICSRIKKRSIFLFRYRTGAEIQVLTKIISIDNVKGNLSTCYMPTGKNLLIFLILGTTRLIASPGTLLNKSDLYMGGNRKNLNSGISGTFILRMNNMSDICKALH